MRSLEIALDGRSHFLEPVNSIERLKRHLIGANGAVIGRKAPAEIVLDDSEVSRAHCQLTLRGDELWIADLNSTNGTYVNGERLTAPMALPVGAIIQVGRQVLKHEWRTQHELLQSDELDRDLEKANAYVQAMLPAPLPAGPIRADWLFQPSAKLGGDAFGYGPLSEDLFACYLVDVSGHGAGAALHSVAIMNVLRQRALPNADMTRPGEVLGALNEMFQMDSHAGMYFTMWYGVFDRNARRLAYASAGHHPGFLAPPDRGEALPLRTRNGMIGAVPGKTYQAAEAEVPPGASLYLFSDGVFEIVTSGGVQWTLQDFLPLILQPPRADLSECQRLHREVTGAARPGGLDDDFTMVVLTLD